MLVEGQNFHGLFVFTLHSNHLIAGSTSCICYIFLTTGEGLNKWLN